MHFIKNTIYTIKIILNKKFNLVQIKKYQKPTLPASPPAIID